MNWRIEHWKGFTAASNGEIRQAAKGEAWLSGWDRYSEQQAPRVAAAMPSAEWVLL